MAHTPHLTTIPLPDAKGKNRLWHPAVIVFVSNTCIMVLELVAGRIIAPYVGVSLYTWTSVIGVVLAGISLGNYLGGQLADRWASLRFLGAVFLLGGLCSLSILATERFGSRLPGWPIIVQILVLTAILFFVPSMVLGAVSPIVAKLAVQDLSRTGSTLGGIYAAGTVGSIMGTFATGFVLIAWLGTRAIVWGVAVVLLIIGVILIANDEKTRCYRWLSLGLGFLIVAGLASYTISRGAWQSICTRETNYFCIRVQETEHSGRPMLMLILDRLVHSYTSLSDPTYLVYTYENIFAEVTAYQAQHHEHLSTLFIGGGGYTFPRYIVAKYPHSLVHVIEIDPGVTKIAYEKLGLQPDSGIVSYNEDARLFMTRSPTRSYDLIIGDAFNDYSVPYHLTTREFNQLVHRWLAPDGLYLINLIDGPRRDFLRAFIYTLRQTFDHVYLVPASTQWQQSPRMTYVLIAGNVPLEMNALKVVNGDDGLVSTLILTPQELDSVLHEGRLVLLTDQYAPVDQMLAPVVRNEPAPATAQ